MNDKTVTEALAEIMWGKPASEVADWLCDKGVTREEAKQVVREALAERSMDFRVRGMRVFGYGAMIFLAALAVGAAFYWLGAFQVYHWSNGRLQGFIALVAGYGVVEILRGLYLIVFSRWVSGSLAE